MTPHKIKQLVKSQEEDRLKINASFEDAVKAIFKKPAKQKEVKK